jgi:RNAse (barnase) inhibitor barstar
MSTEIKSMLSLVSDKAIYYAQPTFFRDENICLLKLVVDELGYMLFCLDGSVIASADDLLNGLSDIMKFPDYFGYDWNPLTDCLRDMEWLPAKGYVILFSHPANFKRNSPNSFKIFLEIIETVFEYWSSRQIRFLLILEE